MEARVTTKGQIVIPATLRRKYGIKRGTRVNIDDDDGMIVLRPATRKALEKLLDRLQGRFKDSPLVQDLMEERARDREREDAGWTPPSV